MGHYAFGVTLLFFATQMPQIPAVTQDVTRGKCACVRAHSFILTLDVFLLAHRLLCCPHLYEFHYYFIAANVQIESLDGDNALHPDPLLSHLLWDPLPLIFWVCRQKCLAFIH